MDPYRATLQVGQSQGFRAFGTYSDAPDDVVDLSGQAAWSPGPVFAAEKGMEGKTFIVTASLEGASDSATITVEGYDPRTDPAAGDVPPEEIGDVPPFDPVPGDENKPSGGLGGGEVTQQPPEYGGTQPPSGPDTAGTQPPPMTPPYPCGVPGSPPCPPGAEPPPGPTWEPLIPPDRGGPPPGPGGAPTGRGTPRGGCPPGCDPRPDGSGCLCSESSAPRPPAPRATLATYVYVKDNEWVCCKDKNETPKPIRVGPLDPSTPGVKLLSQAFDSEAAAKTWLCRHEIAWPPGPWAQNYSRVNGVLVANLPCPRR